MEILLTGEHVTGFPEYSLYVFSRTTKGSKLMDRVINLIETGWIPDSLIRTGIDILRFNRDAKVFLKNSVEEITFGDFLNRGGYSNSLKNDYALPMASAIWSAKSNVIENANFRFFAQFFENHGMLSLNDRPQWRVIKGGSRQYVSKLIKSFKSSIRINSPVEKILRKNQGVEVVFKKQQKELSKLIIQKLLKS